jgi:hypothetical protein
MQHLLKGRFVKILLNLQLAYFQAHHSSNLNCPDIRQKAWRKKVIVAVVTFTLAVWNDRSAIYHGTFLDISRQELIAHVHQSVRN